MQGFGGQSGGSARPVGVLGGGGIRKTAPNAVGFAGATHLLESGTDVRLIQELLGHANINTTLRYTHVSQRSLTAVRSPLDSLLEEGEKGDKK